ncbi:hypothetical protein [Eubacterium ramulus]
MPSIEELLNEAESHMAAQPVNDVLEINPETREISIPDSEIILGVETDQKAERKYFHCPKIVGNNIDLSALELYVVFQNASNKEEGKDRYHVTDVKTTSDGYITFSWELSAKVTAYKGDVQFVVCAIKTDSSGVKQNVWNTTIAIGKCLIGLSSDMSASEEQSASDLYTQLVSELNSTASAKMTEVTTQIQTVGKNQVANVNNAGTTQVNNVQDKGAEVLASIPSTYTELDASVKQLNDQMRGKAPVIVESITSQPGKPVSVSDSAEMPLQGLRVYGKSEQVTTTGKNLCSIKSCQLSTNMASSDIVPWTKKDRIYFSCDTENVDGSKIYVICRYYNESKIRVGTNGTILLADGTRKEISFRGVGASPHGGDVDLTTVEYVNIEIGLQIASTAASSIDNIMVCDEENQPYEPYTGGKPSPSPEYPQEIENVGENGSIGVEITGKNLFNYKAINSAYASYDKDTETLTVIVNTSKAIDFEFEENTQYTFGAYITQSALDVNLRLRVKYTDGTIDNSFLYSNSTKEVYKTGTTKAGKTIREVLYQFGHNGTATFRKLQIEKGTEATSYEPYKQSNATIPLPNGLPGIPVITGGNYTDENGQHYICDEIDFARGKYVQRVWKGVFDGSEDEEWYSGGNYFSIKALPTSMSSREGYCNQYTTKNGKIRIGNGNNSIIIFDADYFENNLSNWKAHLAQHPLVVMTYLDTPIETDLTEAQIQAYKSLTTFKPTSIISNDANAQMDVEYAADTKAWVTNKINTLIKEAITS